MISSPLSKRDTFSPATRLRHVPLKRRAGFAFISRGEQTWRRFSPAHWEERTFSVLPVYVDVPFMFHVL